MNKPEQYKSNIEIVFNDLKRSINDFCNGGHTSGDLRYINAYLNATLGAIAAYFDTTLKLNFMDRTSEPEVIQAIKYANNMIKHDEEIVTHVEPAGGISFPGELPIEFEPIQIIWKVQNLEARYECQKDAFRKLFNNKDVMETLEPIVNSILSDSFKETYAGLLGRKAEIPESHNETTDEDILSMSEDDLIFLKSVIWRYIAFVLQATRLYTGKNIEDVASETGITADTLRKAEQADRNTRLTWKQIEKLAILFGVYTHDLMDIDTVNRWCNPASYYIDKEGNEEIHSYEEYISEEDDVVLEVGELRKAKALVSYRMSEAIDLLYFGNII